MEIIGDSSSLERSLKNAGNSSTTFGNKMGTVLKAGAIAAAAGIGVAAVAIDKMAKAALDAQAQQSRLDQSFKNVGLSADAASQQIDKAEASGRQLGFTDTQTMNALGSLVTATKNTGQAMTDLSVAQDVARFKGVGLEDATKMLTMAMTGSQRAAKQLGITVIPLTTNVDALHAAETRTKESATAAELAHAKLLDKMATGQAVIQAVTDRVHGQSDAFSETSAGAMARFQAAWEHLQVTLGNLVLPTIADVATKLSDVVTWIDNFVNAVKRMHDPTNDAAKATEGLGIMTRTAGAQMDSATKAAYEHQAAIDKVSHAWYATTPVIGQAFTAWKALWGVVWEGGQVTEKILMAIQTATFASAHALAGWATSGAGAMGKFGNAVISGLASAGKAFAAFGNVVIAAFAKFGNILIDAANSAFTLAANIGRSIVSGVISGVMGLGDALASHMKSGVGHAFDSVKSFIVGHSPSQKAADEIGKPLAEGVILGWELGTAQLPTKMKESVRKAIEAARQQIADSRSVLEAAFGDLSSLASNLFGMTREQTTAEKKLAEMQAQDQARALQDAYRSAAEQLQQDRAAGIGLVLSGASPEELAAAVAKVQEDEKALGAAQRAITEANLQLKAEQERKQQDARDAVDQANFMKDIQKLGERLAKKGATAAQATEQIIALLAEYGVNFAAVGRDAGIAYIQALKDAIQEAAGSAGALGGTIASAAGGIAVPKPAKRAAGGPVTAGNFYTVGENGPELLYAGRNGMIIPNGGGGGGNIGPIIIEVDGRTFAQITQQQLLRLKGRSGQLGLA